MSCWWVQQLGSLRGWGEKRGRGRGRGMGKLIIAGELRLSLFMCSMAPPNPPTPTHTHKHKNTHRLSLWGGGHLIRPLKHSDPPPSPFVCLAISTSVTTTRLFQCLVFYYDFLQFLHIGYFLIIPLDFWVCACIFVRVCVWGDWGDQVGGSSQVSAAVVCEGELHTVTECWQRQLDISRP